MNLRGEGASSKQDLRAVLQLLLLVTLSVEIMKHSLYAQLEGLITTALQV